MVYLALNRSLAGSYQALFVAELRRRRYFLVTDCNQISMQFGTQAVFFGTQLKNWVPFGCQLFRVTVCKQDNCVTLE